MELFKKIYWIMLVLGLTVGTVVTGSILVYRQINYSGSVKFVGINAFHDIDMMEPVSEIPLGDVHPGMTYNQTIYLTNNGTVPLTLSSFTEAWNPSEAETYILFTWDGTDVILPPDTLIPVQMSIELLPTTPAIDFSFTLTIQGIS